MNKKLKAFRNFKELTQEDTAKLLGISPHTYFNKETGKSAFTIDEAKKLTDILGVTVDEIFFNDEVFNLKTNASV